MSIIRSAFVRSQEENWRRPKLPRRASPRVGDGPRRAIASSPARVRGASAAGPLHLHVERVFLISQCSPTGVWLLSIFGGLALLLAIIGLYGVMSYAVSQSTRELGLRMALGAEASHVVQFVAFRAFLLTGAGVVLGLGTALAITRLISSLLYQVNPRDPPAFASACVIMIAASLAACLFPAWRATRIDPARALHF